MKKLVINVLVLVCVMVGFTGCFSEKYQTVKSGYIGAKEGYKKVKKVVGTIHEVATEVDKVAVAVDDKITE
mgnify:CR=1 FL=1